MRSLLTTNDGVASFIARVHAALHVVLPTVKAVWRLAADADHHFSIDVTAANRTTTFVDG